MDIYCKICGYHAKSNLSLAKHISMKHEYSSEKYYCEFIEPKVTKRCVICDKKVKFLTLSKGYSRTCGKSCGVSLQWKDIKRLENNKSRFKKYANRKGRPKGSKNKKQYPTNSTKVKERITKSSINKKEQATKMSIKERKEFYGNWFKTTAEKQEKCRKQAIKNVTNSFGNSMKGYFKCKNPQKYDGDPTNIIYRSSWEMKFFMEMDRDPNVKKWSSEELSIPYFSPKDNRIHRYFPDVVYTTLENKTYVVEIKPAYQTKPPILIEGKRKSKRYLNEVITYGVNVAKWKAARAYCKDRGYDFVILTENELGVI